MRRILLPLATVLALTPSAHADQIDNFVLTGNGNTVVFSLPATQTFPSHPHVVDLRYTAPATVNGTGVDNFFATFRTPTFGVFETADIGYSSSNSNSASLVLYGASPVGPVYNPPLPEDPNPYGTITNTFALGTFDLFTEDFNAGSPRTDYNLTVTQAAPTSPAPEPAPMALLATGTLGLLTRVRPSAKRARKRCRNHRIISKKADRKRGNNVASVADKPDIFSPKLS